MKSINLIKPYFLKSRFVIFVGLMCLIVVDFLQLFIPRIIKWVIDDLTAFRIDLIRLLFYALYIVGLAIMIGVFRYGWRRCLIGTSRRIEEGLRNSLVAHIQTLSASYFDKAKTGDLMAHATNDIQHVRMAVGMGIVAFTDAVVLGAAAIGFMAYINLQLTIIALIPMPMIIFFARFFSKKMHRLYQQVQGAFSDLTENVREGFAGIRIIKAYNRQKETNTRLENISKDYISKNLKLVRVTGSFFPIMILFSNLSLAIVLFLGGRQTILTTITAGDFVAFISYIGLLTWPMMAMGWVTSLIQRGAASLDRINKILQTPSRISDSPCAKSIQSVKGGVIFDQVTFFYQPKALPALSGIHIELEPGKVLGIVGPPGSGKTTLLNLIPRLFDVSQGRILIDGTDIRTLKVHDLRAQIAFMPQEPFLFDDTICKNITFNNDKITHPELINVAKEAKLYDTIQSFSKGFETIVGEKGIILSGGQKQRIVLARALLQKTPILILDDPISQVDAETGSEIIKNLRHTVGNRTIIIVSHRLSAVRFADQIVVLDSGHILESGIHAQLMESNQYYAKTFRLQEIEEEFNAS